MESRTHLINAASTSTALTGDSAGTVGGLPPRRDPPEITPRGVVRWCGVGEIGCTFPLNGLGATEEAGGVFVGCRRFVGENEPE